MCKLVSEKLTTLENALNLYPKGLLNCCIVMSKHTQLISWLTRDPKLLHNLIELLLSPDPSIVGDVLTLVENILSVKVTRDLKFAHMLDF